MSSPLPEDEYAGPAVVEVGERRMPVRATLSGRFEPVDGCYRWGGRLAPDGHLADLLRSGQRSVTIQIGDGGAVQARLAEIDPWGGVRVSGVSRPPWATSPAPPSPTADPARRSRESLTRAAGATAPPSPGRR